MSRPRRERRNVVGVESVGPYVLVRVDRGGLDAGTPGQFFMLDAPGRVLPRPMSLCLAPPGELGFLLDPIGPGTCALAELEPGESIHVVRSARKGLPARRRPAGARGRRHRDRTVAVSLRSARATTRSARLQIRVARRSRCARSECRGRDRPGARHRRAAPRPCRARVSVRSRCSRQFARSARTRSSHGRRRWPAGTARVTAASSKSTES